MSQFNGPEKNERPPDLNDLDTPSFLRREFVVGKRNIDGKGRITSSVPPRDLKRIGRFRVTPLDSYQDDSSLANTRIVEKGGFIK